MSSSAKSRSIPVAAVLVCTAAMAYGAAPAGEYRRPAAAAARHVPDEVIVKFKRGVGLGAAAAVHGRHGTREVYTSPFAGFKRVKIPGGSTVEETVERLKAEWAVEYAEANDYCRAFMTPNDTHYDLQWHFTHDEGGGIHVEPAWDVTQGAGVVVAVLDTGAAYEDHNQYRQAPDLAGTAFTAGYDFANDDAHPNDDDSHGTHVTGTIAQTTNNSLGVAGVAHGCTVMPVKVLDGTGSGTDQWLADGIYYATDNGAKVINMSLGFPVEDGVPADPGPTVLNAVAYAYVHGVTLVCASGNDGAGAVAYPAAYDDYCIAVGAVQYDGERAPYSNYGTSLDITAPGGNLDLDQNEDSYGDGVLQNTFDPVKRDPKVFGYWFFDGTSMATPHVSGVAALIISQGYTDPLEVRRRLMGTARDRGEAGWDPEYGAGIVDAYAALGTMPSTVGVSGVTETVPGEDAPVPLYTKYEVEVSLSDVAGMKYYDTSPSAGGVDVTAEFTGPGGSRTAHGFYDGSRWLVRFAPDAAGTWTYSITVEDMSGTTTWTGGEFECTASSEKGWVRVNGKDLELANGEAFFGVGHNTGWQYDVEQPTPAAMAAAGENVLSFWMAAPWSLAGDPAQEHRAPVENGVQGHGEYNQDACAYLDSVVANAEADHVYLLPTIWSHGQLRDANHAWSRNSETGLYTEHWWSNNGYSRLCSVTEFFRTTYDGTTGTPDTPQWRYQKDFYRYLLARWGYSFAIAGWVALCEADGTTAYGGTVGADPALVGTWCRDVRQYFADNDWYRANGGAYPVTASKLDDADWEGGFTGGFDMLSTDSYAEMNDEKAVAGQIADQTLAMAGKGKPCLHAEFGGRIGSGGTSQPEHLHNGIWAGAAAGAAMTPLVWCDGGEFPMLDSGMREQLEYLGEFMGGVDYLNESDTAAAEVTVSDADCRCWVRKRSTEGFGWMLHTTADSVGGQTFSIGDDIEDGEYVVLWYDCWASGEKAVWKSDSITASGGSLPVTVPALSRADTAFRFMPYSEMPTYACMGGGSVEADARSVRLSWTTVTEHGNAGFEVTRRERCGVWKRIGFVEGAWDSAEERNYGLTDREVEPGHSYEYAVRDVGTGGGAGRYVLGAATVPGGGLEEERRPGARAGSWDGRVFAVKPARKGRGAAHAAAGPAEDGRWRPPPDGAMKLTTAGTGLTAFDAGVTGAGRRIVMNRGRAVGSCVKDGRIVFYARDPGSRYTDRNVYWIVRGDRAGGGRGVAGSKPVPGAAGETTSYREIARAEENTYYVSMAPHMEEIGDGFVSAQILRPGRSAEYSVEVSERAPGGELLLRFSILPYCTFEDVEEEHRLEFFVNGVKAGESAWDGDHRLEGEIALRQEMIVAGGNSIRITCPARTDIPYDLLAVDWVEVEYERRLAARDGRLEFTIDGGAGRTVAVAGVDARDAVVMDVTREGGEYAVEFSGNGAGGIAFVKDAGRRRYAVGTMAGMAGPVEAGRYEDRRIRLTRADYAVVAHGSLLQAAGRIADYRERQGMKTAVFDVTDVTDEFNWGVSGPEAVRRMARSIAPKYMLLVGDAVYDPKGYLGDAGGQMVPTCMMTLGAVGETCTDTPLACLDGDGIPDVKTGRIPARTPEEVETVYRKTVAFEEGGSAWAGPDALVVADGGEEFERDSDGIHGVLEGAGYSAERAYLADMGAAALRGRINEALDAGTRLVTYVGHGGVFYWSREKVLDRATAERPGANGSPAVILAGTCVNGMFTATDRRRDSAAEFMLFAAAGGAAAYVASSAMDDSEPQAQLIKHMVEEVGRGMTLGEALAAAKEAVGADAGSGSVVEGYMLFGDPALRVFAGDRR